MWTCILYFQFTLSNIVICLCVYSAYISLNLYIHSRTHSNIYIHSEICYIFLLVFSATQSFHNSLSYIDLIMFITLYVHSFVIAYRADFLFVFKWVACAFMQVCILIVFVKMVVNECFFVCVCACVSVYFGVFVHLSMYMDQILYLRNVFIILCHHVAKCYSDMLNDFFLELICALKINNKNNISYYCYSCNQTTTIIIVIICIIIMM